MFLNFCYVCMGFGMLGLAVMSCALAYDIYRTYKGA